MNKVAIIIVNWNGLRFLKDCFSAIQAQTYKNFDVYFVDNGSVDESVSFVEKNFPNTKLVKLKENTGFAKGNNIGIKKALEDKTVEHVVCLNNDTIVSSDWLWELAESANKKDNIGMVSSLALFPDGTIHNAGLSLEKGLEINKNGGISIGYGRNKDFFKEEKSVFAPGGMAALYKRACIEQIFAINNEFFDEDFFSYEEDLDVGFAAQILGWKCTSNPRAKLIHFQSQTFGKASVRKIFYMKRNVVLLAIKYLSFRDFILFTYYQLGLCFSYLNKKNDHSGKKIKTKASDLAFSVIKGYIYSIALIPRMLKKRKKIMKNKNDYSFRQWVVIYNRLYIENDTK